MVNCQIRFDRPFAALVDPTRRAILDRVEQERGISVTAPARPFAIKLHARQQRTRKQRGWNGALDKLNRYFNDLKGASHGTA
jgi:hypothetical protein